jgi:hypothetical protein
MVNINRDDYVPKLKLNKSSISVNNMKLTLDEQNNITIQTGSEWKGSVSELNDLIQVMQGDFENAYKFQAEGR